MFRSFCAEGGGAMRSVDRWIRFVSPRHPMRTPPAKAFHANAASIAPSLAYVPPTQTERFHRYLKGLFGPEALLRAAAGSGVSQLTGTPHEWGQGAEGYFRRYGNDFAEHTIRQTLMYGSSAALGEDNRYFRSEQSGFGRRTIYAAESTFLARRSDGTRRVSYSRIGAIVATAFISREWQPRSTDNARHAFANMGTTAASEIGFNVVREFLPDLFHHHH